MQPWHTGKGLLTRRELQVAGLIAEGLTNKLIASRLGVSVNTINKHVQSALDKTGAHNRAQLAALIAASGRVASWIWAFLYEFLNHR